MKITAKLSENSNIQPQIQWAVINRKNIKIDLHG